MGSKDVARSGKATSATPRHCVPTKCSTWCWPARLTFRRAAASRVIIRRRSCACRFELRGDIADYCKVAAAHLAPGGFLACVFPTEQLKRVENAALAAKLGIVRRRPVVLREGNEPLLSLFGMVRSDHLPARFREQTWVEPALVIRGKNGEVHPEYAALKLAIGFPP